MKCPHCENEIVNPYNNGIVQINIDNRPFSVYELTCTTCKKLISLLPVSTVPDIPSQGVNSVKRI